MFEDIKEFGNRIFQKAQPTSYIASGKSEGPYDMADEALERTSFETLEKFYLKEVLVFSGINLFSHACFGKGLEVVSENKQAQKLCEDVTKLTSFNPSIIKGIIDTFTYGISFTENIWKGNDIVGFNITDPKTIKMDWNEHGVTTKYRQLINGTQKKVWDVNKITFMKFFSVADSKKGIGFIEPLIDILNTKKDFEKSLAEIIRKFAVPPVHVVKMGAKTKAEITAVEKKFKDFNRRSFFGTSEKYKITPLPLANKIPDMSFQYDAIIDQIAAGLRVPKAFLLGKADAGSATRAGAIALMDYSFFEISLIQEKMVAIIEDQIFRPLCEKNGLPVPDVIWKPFDRDAKTLEEIRNLRIRSASELYKSEILDKEQVIHFIETGEVKP